MKKLILIVAMAFCANLIAGEVPIVIASGGSGKQVNWPAVKKAEDSEDGPGFFYNDCAQGVQPVRSSSTLPPQGTKNYDLKNISDENPMTAWVEGKKGDGIGAYFEISTPFVNTIYNGYQASPQVWQNNARVKTFKVYRNGRLICRLVLRDEMGEQNFELPIDNDSLSDQTVYRFEIIEVYKGLKYDDAAISEIDWIACCFPGKTLITGFAGSVRADSISEQDSVLTFNIASKTAINTTPKKIARQVHTNLIKITCGETFVEVTPDHPLYIKDAGFISLESLARKRNVTAIGELAGTFELLRWNTTLLTFEYCRPNSLETLTGTFETYSILELESGTIYAINGFLTEIYKPNASAKQAR